MVCLEIISKYLAEGEVPRSDGQVGLTQRPFVILGEGVIDMSWSVRSCSCEPRIAVMNSGICAANVVFRKAVSSLSRSSPFTLVGLGCTTWCYQLYRQQYAVCFYQ